MAEQVRRDRLPRFFVSCQSTTPSRGRFQKDPSQVKKKSSPSILNSKRKFRDDTDSTRLILIRTPTRRSSRKSDTFARIAL
jgi:hypothetical protein